jgi:uncharacterized DUF497 family protein
MDYVKSLGRGKEYEWDPDKAKSNLKKHGISFKAAMAALEDPYRLEGPDPHECEERTRVLCLYKGMTVLFVVTAEPEEGVCRIITARRAEPHERERYNQNRALQQR